jgi:translation initiation factor 1 (eIF-1/SUI1)
MKIYRTGGRERESERKEERKEGGKQVHIKRKNEREGRKICVVLRCVVEEGRR